MKLLRTALLAAVVITLVALANGCQQKTSTAGPAAGKTLVIFTASNEVFYSNSQLTYNVASSDKRTAGKLEVTFDPPAKDDSDLQGTLVLSNDQGTWRGDLTGVNTTKSGTHIVYVRFTAKGTGDYEGLELQASGYLGPQNDGFGLAQRVVISQPLPRQPVPSALCQRALPAPIAAENVSMPMARRESRFSRREEEAPADSAESL